MGLHAPGLDAREIQQRVDQLGQPQTVAVNESSSWRACSSTPVVLAQQFVERSEDQGERGAELVADVGEERGLGPVEFGQRLGPLLLGLVAACAAHSRSDVTGHQLDEAAIAVVESAMPVQRGDQEPQWRAALLQKRHHQRLLGRLAPGAGRQIQCPTVELDQFGFTRGFLDRPYRGAAGRERLRRRRMPGRDSTDPGQLARHRRRRTGRSG